MPDRPALQFSSEGTDSRPLDVASGLQQLVHQRFRLFRGDADFAKCERAFAGVEDGLQVFQGWQIGAAREEADRDLVAPLVAAVDRRVQVGWVVALFAQPTPRLTRTSRLPWNPSARSWSFAPPKRLASCASTSAPG